MKKLLILLTLTACLPLTAQTERENIAPLLQTSWGQGTPYNLRCPTINGRHCQTGCVATAMAQIMNYFQWPEQSEGIPAYQTERLTVDSLPPKAFNWAQMRNRYDGAATEEERQAVAGLMQYCGAAVEMDYGVSTSAAWEGDAAKALPRYFGYASSAREVFRNMYGRTAWENLIYHELAEGRPVFYSGMPNGYLHQFVCDGYKDGKFHFNLAWSFSNDGYYSLSTIDHYPEGQAAIIGIRRPDGTAYGETFRSAAFQFTIIGPGEVSVRQAEGETLTGDLVIPANIVYEGTDYRVTTLEYGAFEDCPGITGLTLPASITVIGRRAVLGCPQLEHLSVEAGNPWYRADGNVLTNTEGNELIAYPMGKADGEYQVPEGVTDIPASFFRGNSHLRQVVLPASVTAIDILAFRDCSSLSSIVSRNSNPKAIEDMAFDDQTYQTATLTVPKGASEAYKKRAGWRNFKNIVEEQQEPSGISGPQQAGEKAPVTLYRTDGTATNRPATGKTIYIAKRPHAKAGTKVLK